MPKKPKRVVRDKHHLYSAAVQSVDADVDFFVRVYKRKRGRAFRRFREDFCGTAALACEWVRRGADHIAWGIDLDRKTLDWGMRQNVAALGSAGRRVHLLRADVKDVTDPRVDVIAAQNFSFCVFKTREELGGYFAAVRSSLCRGGIFFVDLYGGTSAICEDKEKRRIAGSEAFDGTKVPPFTYTWTQASFNPVDHRMVCHIGFVLRDGTKLKRAFTYDWRLWTLPEVQELMLEAGFTAAEVYVEGWDDEADDTDGIFRRRVRFKNQSGWVAYVVGLT